MLALVGMAVKQLADVGHAMRWVAIVA